VDDETRVNEVAVFSDKIQIDFQALGEGLVCCVIDNALTDPDALVRFATKARASFVTAQPDGDPGLELLMANAFTEKVGDFFRRHVRNLFDARRAVGSRSQLSLATAPSESARKLAGIVPHRFGSTLPVNQCIAKCELYLFQDETLGGTGFYRSKSDAIMATPDAFERMSTLPARYNRMVFFDGSILHASQLPSGEKLSTEPAKGRLTLEAYFVCQRKAGRIANRFMR
jgi:Family of unknown function (DUF6445)